MECEKRNLEWELKRVGLFAVSLLFFFFFLFRTETTGKVKLPPPLLQETKKLEIVLESCKLSAQ